MVTTTNSTRIKGSSQAPARNDTTLAPASAKKNAATAAGTIDRQGIVTRGAYCHTAMPVPQIDAALLVPRTLATSPESAGGSSTSNAGNWMSPPPPTTASTKPARK